MVMVFTFFNGLMRVDTKLRNAHYGKTANRFAVAGANVTSQRPK
jgi:hypothetical protein